MGLQRARLNTVNIVCLRCWEPKGYLPEQIWYKNWLKRRCCNNLHVDETTAHGWRLWVLSASGYTIRYQLGILHYAHSSPQVPSRRSRQLKNNALIRWELRVRWRVPWHSRWIRLEINHDSRHCYVDCLDVVLVSATFLRPILQPPLETPLNCSHSCRLN